MLLPWLGPPLAGPSLTAGLQRRQGTRRYSKCKVIVGDARKPIPQLQLAKELLQEETGLGVLALNGISFAAQVRGIRLRW